MTKEEIKAIFKELADEGYLHRKCPWEDVEQEKIDTLIAMEQLPKGAVSLICWLNNTLAAFGEKVGRAIAAGLLVLLGVLAVLGMFGFGKLCTWIMESVGK